MIFRLRLDQISVMTPSDVNGLKMKLIHKKKLNKLLAYLSENPPRPDRPSLPESSAPALASPQAPGGADASKAVKLPPSGIEPASEDSLDEEPSYASSPARSSNNSASRRGGSQDSNTGASDSSSSADFMAYMSVKQASSSTTGNGGAASINEGAESNSSSSLSDTSEFPGRKGGLSFNKNRRRTPREDRRATVRGLPASPPKLAAREDESSISPARSEEQRGRSREASPRGSRGSLTSPNRIQTKKQLRRESAPGIIEHDGIAPAEPVSTISPVSSVTNENIKKGAPTYSGGGGSGSGGGSSSSSSKPSRSRTAGKGGSAAPQSQSVQLASFSPSYGSPPKSPTKWQQQQQTLVAPRFDDDEEFALLSAKVSQRFSLSAQKLQRRPKAKPDFSLSEAIAEMEKKNTLLISAITTQTQRLDSTRADVEALEAKLVKRKDEQVRNLTMCLICPS